MRNGPSGVLLRLPIGLGVEAGSEIDLPYDMRDTRIHLIARMKKC